MVAAAFRVLVKRNGKQRWNGVAARYERRRAGFSRRTAPHRARAHAARATPGRARQDNDVVKLLSEGTDGSVYLHATATHLKASVAALQQLAERVTARDVRADAEAVQIRLAHMEHGAFLTSQLFGTNVLPFTGRTLPARDFGV